MNFLEPRIVLLKIIPLLLLLVTQSGVMAQAPQITQPPVGQTVTEGQIAQFTVLATGSSLVYLWLKDGVPLVDGGRIGGATAPTLNIGGALQSDVGYYSVVVSVSGSPDLKVSSDGVLLKVNPVTPSTPQITQQPIPVTVTEGQSGQFTVVASGTNLVYQWVKDGVALIDGARINGSSTATLFISGALVTDTGGYSAIVTVSGYPELKTSSEGALLKVNVATPLAPIITQQPLGQIVIMGKTVLFTVSVTGSSLVYQWARDGVALSDGERITGATTAALTITGAQAMDGGSYSVVVSISGFPDLKASSDAVLFVVIPASELLWKGQVAPIFVDIEGGRYFGIRFNRLIGALGAAIHIEGSANLRDWIDATPSMVLHGSPEVSSDGIRETVTFRCPLPLSDPNASGLRFLRLALPD